MCSLMEKEGSLPILGFACIFALVFAAAMAVVMTITQPLHASQSVVPWMSGDIPYMDSFATGNS
jgi:hypothetical protein